MITAAIESLLDGDSDHPPAPDTTILWVTDQPELNEQTRRKMLLASSSLGPNSFVMINASFDQETLTPGVIHFINIQKLGREKDLVVRGDERSYTIWETITNTIATRKNFFVIVDEAHRGMSENPRVRNEATTIVQKFIKGSPGEISPVPTVVGISATPERFNRLVEGTSRTARSTVIKPEDVRAFGLLKEIITLYHPTEKQPSDMTMLRAAAQSCAGTRSCGGSIAKTRAKYRSIPSWSSRSGTGPRASSREPISTKPSASSATRSERCPTPHSPTAFRRARASPWDLTNSGTFPLRTFRRTASLPSFSSRRASTRAGIVLERK